MLRDTIKNQEYFINYIKQQEQRIEKFQFKLNNNEVSEERVYAVQEKIDSIEFQLFIAKYSNGIPVENLIGEYKNLVKNMPNFWCPSSGYVDMLWMVSIGVMLEVDDEIFEILIELVEQAKLDDFLLSFLIHSRKSEMIYSQNKFLYKSPYNYLLNVINQENHTAINNLKKYLEEYWYRGHSDTGWFDIHKNQQKLYYGYWSFESGAIAKILQLDDEILKDTSYYPYDMVHYKEN